MKQRAVATVASVVALGAAAGAGAAVHGLVTIGKDDRVQLERTTIECQVVGGTHGNILICSKAGTHVDVIVSPTGIGITKGLKYDSKGQPTGTVLFERAW